MKWYGQLYLGDGVLTDSKKIINRIKKNKPTPNIYMIVLSDYGSPRLELIPTWELLQKSYPKERLAVFGLADGKSEAIGLVQRIVEEAYEKNSDADPVSYLREKWRAKE